MKAVAEPRHHVRFHKGRRAPGNPVHNGVFTTRSEAIQRQKELEAELSEDERLRLGYHFSVTSPPGQGGLGKLAMKDPGGLGGKRSLKFPQRG